MRRQADPRLLSELEKGVTDRSESIRKICTSALIAIGEPALPVFEKALAHPDWRVRNNAVVAIGCLKDAERLQLLKGMMHDEHERVRIAAVEVAAGIGGERAAQLLIKEVEEQPRAVRIGICKALGEIGTDNALEALPTFFTDEYYGVRYYAAEAVVLGRDAAVPHLIDTLQDSADTRSRALSVRALGVIGDPAALDPLVRALEDPSPTVRRLAIWSLGNLGLVDAWEPLQEMRKGGSWSERRHAQYALDRIKRRVFLDQQVPARRMY